MSVHPDLMLVRLLGVLLCIILSILGNPGILQLVSSYQELAMGTERHIALREHNS